MHIKARNQIEKAVLGYFQEIVDPGDMKPISRYFKVDCVVNRPDSEKPLIGIHAVSNIIAWRNKMFGKVTTTVHDMFSYDDRVVVRISHDAEGKGVMDTRIGQFDLAGKQGGWNAMSIFRFEDGLISEQWVAKDELEMISQFGALNEECRKIV